MYSITKFPNHQIIKLIFGLLFMTQSLTAQISFEHYPVYQGNDLGLTYSKTNSHLRIWAPTATEAQILLYKTGAGDTAYKTANLQKDIEGTWHINLPGDLKGIFYTFRVKINNKWNKEVPDPYAKAVGVNGKRAVIIQLEDTNPPGWLDEKSPSFSTDNKPTDAIIYELHVRDASMSKNSGIIHKGKFIGLAETGTLSRDGLSTGIDHLKELGVTHIHLLPFYDYSSVNESKPDSTQYNWGYDPLNYNVPEGSYSTNANDGISRIRELKEMIQAFHKNGLRVIFDAVYNHTALTENSNFNQLVPGYYYRHTHDGKFSDATGCNNETASENPMMRKFMRESLLYWAREYHIDGFRFDLMGVHDIQTMNLVSQDLHAYRPDILLYGEGWAAGDSPLPDSLRAIKSNAAKLDRIAVFSDDMRDGIKGSVFKSGDRGFVSDKHGSEESVKFGIVASCMHSQIQYSQKAYAAGPWNVITYCECHDNNTLWDKLEISCPDATLQDRKKMQQLALTIVLTSQGIPFLHAGTEFLRTKKGVENSYKSSDSINAIDWKLKKENLDLVKYVESLIQMRKQHPSFRMTTSQQVAQLIQFDETAPAGTIVYQINGEGLNDSWKKIWIAFNGSSKDQKLQPPAGKWKTAINTSADDTHAVLTKYSAVILFQ